MYMYICIFKIFEYEIKYHFQKMLLERWQLAKRCLKPKEVGNHFQPWSVMMKMTTAH